MLRALLLGLLLLAPSLRAQDVFVPPVLKGIGPDGSRRAEESLPLPDGESSWLLVRSPHFEIITDAGERRARSVAARLESLASAVTRIDPRFAAAPAPTRIFLLRNRRDLGPWFDLLLQRRDARVNGVFVTQGDAGTMLISDGSDWRRDRTPFHELIHALIASAGTRPPLWIEEGLAEYFSNAVLEADRVRVGLPIREHQALMQRRPRIPLARVFAMDASSEGAASPMFYAQSWAAVSILLERDERAFFELLADLEDGAPSADALAQRFDLSVGDLEGMLAAGASRARSIPVGQAPAPAVTPATRADVLFAMGSFLNAIEGVESEARRFLTAALAENPRHAGAMAELGDYAGALAAAPDDPRIRLGWARRLLGRALGPLAGTVDPAEVDEGAFLRARRLASEALALGGDEGEARAILGASYLAEDDARPAIAELERALELLPRREDVGIHLYAFHLRSRDAAGAARVRARLEASRDPQVRMAVATVFLREQVAISNALVRENKYEEAALVAREIAAALPEDKGRRDLEQQAASLLAVAAANREIEQYNRAVRAVNEGRKGEARKILDALIASATDETVRRDAARLRASVGR